MSKVSINVDTETYDCSVTVNGATVENVLGAHFIKYKDYEGNYKVGVSISTYTQDEAGVKTYTMIEASDSPNGRKAIQAGAVPNQVLPGFVVTSKESEVQRQLASYFSKKRA